MTNSAGLVSNVANRTLKVKITCPKGESVCSNQIECSVNGACLADLAGGAVADEEAEPANQPPALALKTYEGVLSSFVTVRRYSSYVACAPGVVPLEDVLCEPGAEAEDPEDGNLTSRVLACPPASCLSKGTGCDGHQFAKKGIQVSTPPPQNCTQCKSSACLEREGVD